MRLRVKTILIFLVLSLVPLFVVGGFAYSIAKNTIEKSLGENFRQVASETIDRVDRSMYELYQNLNTWSKLDVMKEVITGDLDGNISTYLMELQREYGYFSSLFALDSSGKVVASNSPELFGRDFSKRKLFKNAVQGTPFIEDAHLDEAGNTWVVTFSFPIRAKFLGGKTIGVLGALWKIDELDALLQVRQPAISSEDPDPLIFLTQGNGSIISAPILGNQGTLFQVNLIEEGVASAALANRRAEGYRVEGFPILGLSLLGYSYSKGYRDYPGLNWSVVVAQDTATAFSPIRQLNSFILAVGALVPTLVVILSLWVSRKMTRPILNIAEAARRVSLGDLDGQTDYRSSDEIGSLSNVFNQMVGNLRKQRDQLVDKHYVDSIIANMLNSLIVTNVEGKILTVNKATLDLLKTTEGEIVGSPMASILEEQSFQKLPENLVENGHPGNIEAAYKTKNGETVPVLLSSSVIQDDRGEIQQIVCVAQDITERKKAEQTLAEQAIRDPLTGLYNRRFFDQRIQNEMARSDRTKQALAVLLCDMDGLKAVNDTKGHQAGDEALKAVAKSILDSTRGIDLAFRWGGDEFMVILPQTTREGAHVVAGRIRSRLSKNSPEICPGLDLSIGIASYPEHGTRDDELIRVADLALYIAKKRGDKIHFGAEEYQLDERVIKVVFQPIVAVKPTGNLQDCPSIAYEALSRDPNGKLNVFELFKKYETIGKLEDLKAICFKKQLQAAEQLRLKSVFLNVDFILLAKAEMLCPKPPDLEVVLEISEREALYDIEEHLKTTMKWRKLGYKFAIDDFGAGFISLPFIARLVPDYIKLDRATVLQAVASRQFNDFMAGLVVALRSYVREGIIAEGVETEKEWRVMENLGINLAQGYLFGKPKELP